MLFIDVTVEIYDFEFLTRVKIDMMMKEGQATPSIKPSNVVSISRHKDIVKADSHAQIAASKIR